MVDRPQDRRPLQVILANGLQAVALNTVIALGITLFGGHTFADNLVYSQCIGLSIMGLIEFGRRWLIPQPKQQWRRFFWLVPLCVALGFTLGTLLADYLLGAQSASYWVDAPRQASGFLVMSLVAGGVSTYYFMSRARLAETRQDVAQASAQAQAAQRQAAESQLKLLETQLEPHMLFNTLANLHALIGSDPARAQHMLDHLVTYLRATLSGSRATSHSLQAEFDRLRDYLELMSIRMGPRLQYTLDLPAELAALPVPPLLLQPLVENAIQHGLEPQVAGGSITVRARLDTGQVTLAVLDTGRGLAHAALPAAGFGLTQVQERLATIFGNQGTVALTSGKTTGTSACITFPSASPIRITTSCPHPPP